MDRDSCQRLLTTILNLSKADETFVSFNGIESRSINIGTNRILPSSQTNDAVVNITVRVGKHYASVSGNALDELSLRSLIRQAIALAPHLPEVNEVVPFPPKVEVRESSLTADESPSVLWQTDTAKILLDAVQAKDLLATGKVSVSENTTAVAASTGLFLYQPTSIVHVQTRVSAPDGKSTGFEEQRTRTASEIHADRLVGRAVEKCLAWRYPVTIKPERMTTVFEPQALADILFHFMRQFDAQAVKDNRSFLRKLDGTSRVGMEMFPQSFSISSDPYSPVLPSIPFTMEGLPLKLAYWIRNGVIETLVRSRFQASEGPVTPFPSNLFVTGGSDTLEQVIAQTKRGLLITGFSTLSLEDPTNCLLTGSTKDGLFMIEDGKIVRGVQNLILRETPVYLFKRMEQVGISVATHPRTAYFPMLVPPIRVTDVMYTRHSGLV